MEGPWLDRVRGPTGDGLLVAARAVGLLVVLSRVYLPDVYAALHGADGLGVVAMKWAVFLLFPVRRALDEWSTAAFLVALSLAAWVEVVSLRELSAVVGLVVFGRRLVTGGAWWAVGFFFWVVGVAR